MGLSGREAPLAEQTLSDSSMEAEEGVRLTMMMKTKRRRRIRRRRGKGRIGGKGGEEQILEWENWAESEREREQGQDLIECGVLGEGVVTEDMGHPVN